MSAKPDRSNSGASLQLALKVLIGVMALMIVVGVGAVAVRLLQLAGRPDAAKAEQTLTLPEGAAIRALSLSGSRVAVHYNASGRDAIAVHDIESDRLVTTLRIDSLPAAP